MKYVSKRIMSLLMAMILLLATLSACGQAADEESTTSTNETANEESSQEEVTSETAVETVGGKILFMVNTSSGPVYDFSIKYMEMWTKELGYTYEIIYGDPANDPAGNLTSVKNAMTNDVKGLVMMQDGGVSAIMDEYPELYVVGLATDMASVFNEEGTSASVRGNANFLGTVAGGYANGENIGKMYAQAVIDAGYKKIATIMVPAFAYPQYAIADATIRAEIAAYNETASEPIEIVGEEAAVVMFRPLDDTFFNEPVNQDLDAIIGLCAGQAFIYPTMANAMGNGIANGDMKLLTSGMEGDQALVDDVGTGIVAGLFVPNYEELFFGIAMLDNAIQGTMYEDFSDAEVLDGVYVRITSDEVMKTIEENSALLTADMSKVSVSIEDGKAFLKRYNPDATYAELKAFMESDAFSEKAYQ